MNIKQHYCIVTQEEANEARELLVMAGERMSNQSCDFEPLGSFKYLQCVSNIWFVGFVPITPKHKLTYPQFKEILNAKIKEDGK